MTKPTHIPPGGVSTTDARILDDLARRGRNYLIFRQDQAWLGELTSQPRLQLSRMVRRGSLYSLGAGRFVVAPPGTSSIEQAAPFQLLLHAYLEGRAEYYLGFLSAMIEHGLTDIWSKEAYIAVLGNQPKPSRPVIAGRPVRLTRILNVDQWFGVEMVRAQGKTMYARSDLERTLLDILRRPRLCGGPEVWVRAWARAFEQEIVRLDRLVEYAERSRGPVPHRAAFWLDQLGHGRLARSLVALKGGPHDGQLYPHPAAKQANWGRDRLTGLRINLAPDAITGWLSYGR